MEKKGGQFLETWSFPEQLINDVKNGNMALFLGPLFSSSNGFKPIGEFLKQLLMDNQAWTTQQEIWHRDKKYHRVAQGCLKVLENKQDNFFKELKYEYGRNLRLGPLYRMALMLPSRGIVSTNLDGLLKNYSHQSRKSIKHKADRPSFFLTKTDDRSKALTAAKNGQPHVAFAQGLAEVPESVILPFLLFDNKKDMLIEYLSLLLNRGPALCIGFEPDDVFIGWMSQEVFPSCSHHPRYFVDLTLNDEMKRIDGYTWLKIPYSEELMQPDGANMERQRVQNVLVTLLHALHEGNESKPLTEKIDLGEDKWEELTEELLIGEVLKNTDTAQNKDFYLGNLANWFDIDEDRDAERQVNASLRSYLRTQRLRVALLTAPSGFGKTTVASRVAYDLWKNDGFKVFWLEDPVLFPPSLSEKIDKNKNILIVADHVQYLGDLHLWLEKWRSQGFNRLRVLLVGRTHEVLSGGLRLAYIRRVCEFREFSLPWITSDEARCFINKLRQKGRLPEDCTDIEEQVKIFTEKAQGDLLAALLILKHGDHLVKIVANVCERVLSWPRGRTLLKAYAIVAAIDQLRDQPDSPIIQCTGRLFRDVLKQETKDTIQDAYSILNHLPDELKLEMDREVLHTRHQVIARAVCQALFQEGNIQGVNGSLFNEIELYESIVTSAGIIGQFPELRLTSIIPIYYYQLKEDPQNAGRLFQVAHHILPGNAVILKSWAQMEEQKGNFKEARKLYKKGTEADPTYAPSWQAWALMEERTGNIEEARKLYKKGTEADPTDAPSWQAWALMEERQKNRDLAMVLISKGLENNPNNKYLRNILKRIETHGSLPDLRFLQAHKLFIEKTAEQQQQNLTNESSVSSLLYGPTSITQGIEFGEQRILSYLLGGLALRLGLPVVLIQFPQGEPELVYPVEAPLKYPEFCGHLLSTYELRHLKEHPCREDIRKRAHEAWTTFKNEERALDDPLILTCHIGISSMYMPFKLHGKLVGMLLIGKFLLDEKKPVINKAQEILNFLENVSNLSKDSQNQLSEARKHLPSIPGNNEEFRVFSHAEINYRFNTHILQGASSIQKAVTLMHKAHRSEKGDRVLTAHRLKASLDGRHLNSDTELRNDLAVSLKTFAMELGVAYASLFVALEPKECYLYPVAMGGIDGTSCQFKAYIDRRGADIPEQMLRPEDWRYSSREQDFKEQALCGADKERFSTISLAVGFSHLGHPGILCLGPFSEDQRLTDEDNAFIHVLCFRFGMHLSGQYVSNRYRLNREMAEISFHLAVHEIKNKLHRVNAGVGVISGKIKKGKIGPDDAFKVQSILKEILELGDTAELALNKPLSSFIDNKEKMENLQAQPTIPNVVCYLAPVVFSVIDNSRKQADERAIILSHDKRFMGDFMVAMEPSLVKEVVSCLLDNAIKYGKKGCEIRIKLWGDNNKAFVSVSGPGQRMSLEDEVNIFEKKKQHSNGSGFGLYLVHAAVKSWGGHAKLESNEIPDDPNFKIYTFWFTVPVAKEETR